MDDVTQADTVKRLCFHCIRSCLQGKGACEKCIHGCVPASMITDNQMEDTVVELVGRPDWM